MGKGLGNEEGALAPSAQRSDGRSCPAVNLGGQLDDLNYSHLNYSHHTVASTTRTGAGGRCHIGVRA